MSETNPNAAPASGKHPLLLIVGGLFAMAAGAFMFWFMLSMGQNMGYMTTSVVQMSADVGAMAKDMRSMAKEMVGMGRSISEGQRDMGADFKKVRIGMLAMTGDMAKMSKDMHNLNVNIAGMTGNIGQMSQAMLNMNASMGAMNQSIGRMDANMARMAVDINKFTRPESIMMPFR